MRVLVLGGTAEARALAALLVAQGDDVESSLAGRVRNPALPAGRVRVGGFGGAPGLADHLTATRTDVLVDATHPFATRISANAAVAARAAGVPLVRLLRPGWRGHPLASGWHWVGDYDRARQAAEQLGGRPFLTTGRQTLPHFGSWVGRDVLVRVVEPLEQVPDGWSVLLDRGPYDVAGELALLRAEAVGVLLTKDSGGTYTAAKLEAAARAGVPVVIVERPALPDGVPSVEDAVQVQALLRRL